MFCACVVPDNQRTFQRRVLRSICIDESSCDNQLSGDKAIYQHKWRTFFVLIKCRRKPWEQACRVVQFIQFLTASDHVFYITRGAIGPQILPSLSVFGISWPNQPKRTNRGVEYKSHRTQHFFSSYSLLISLLSSPSPRTTIGSYWLTLGMHCQVRILLIRV